MVNLAQIRTSNDTFTSSPASHNLVAVFIGATSGIGLGTLKAFYTSTTSPKVYIIGRSKSSFQSHLDQLAALNPGGKYEFVETEVSLIRNVDRVCEMIKGQEKSVDLLFMSPGYLSSKGREDSIEGLDIPSALRYYARLRFTSLLLPLLACSRSPRVISILGGGKEKPIDLDDLELRSNFSQLKAMTYGTTMMTLAFEELAKEWKGVLFVHKYPGFVDTGAIGRFLSSVKGAWSVPALLARVLFLPFVSLLATSIEEAGEQVLFLATSARYQPSKPGSENVGVEMPEGVEVARSSVVDEDGVGNGVYRLDATNESAEESEVLVKYRKEGVERLVWEHTEKVWERALAREV
ncbi:hypothetical protein BGZ60DRAFT_218243 [Tricladium varicosporioides]|nr:hypothetical protein BGZ60DRAFT_218243 [Hymenoscyphus varicosporioides]